MSYKNNDCDNYFSYEVDPSLNEVVDENGSTSVVLRRAKWGGEKSKFKLELRRCYVNAVGEEKVGKGCTFITEDGPNKLAAALLKHGFGDTREILNNIKGRNDFNISMRAILSDEDIEAIKNTFVPDDEYFDPKAILVSEDYVVLDEEGE